MAHNNIEIEIQVQVEKVEPLLAFLTSQAQFQKEAHQIDEYFSPGDKDFLKIRPVKEWLRIREADGIASITYKDRQYDADGKSQFSTEYETRVEQVEQIRNILNALTYSSMVVVDKVRKTYLYKDYEITIDSVKGLGEFIEIEYCGTHTITDPKKVTDDMVEFLKEVGCGKITRNYRGYPFLLLFPDDRNEETI